MHNPKRKVYHEHIILLIEGRLLMLFFVAGLIWLWMLFIRDWSDSCASFDMFKDFEDRGRIFKEKVMAMK